MAPTATFRMADLLTEGRLAEIIARKRTEGRSLEAIARDLFNEYGIEVTRQTLSNWARAGVLDGPKDAA